MEIVVKLTESSTVKLPELNCSNCKYYKEKPQLLRSMFNEYYALECINFVHPIQDCILEGFTGHSENTN